MNSRINSRPLLETNSDSEDINDDIVEHVRRRNIENAEGSSLTNHFDNAETDVHGIESNTDDFDDETQILFKANNTIPNDRFSFTYMVFYLLGMTSLVPWNFFMTAEDVSKFLQNS